MPSSIASVSARGNRPAQSPSQDRSTNFSRNGTATESTGNPVTAASSNTFPARPARSVLEVGGATCVCQKSTPRISSEDSTTTVGARRVQSSKLRRALPRSRSIHSLGHCRRILFGRLIAVCQCGTDQQHLGARHRRSSRVTSKLPGHPSGEGDVEPVNDWNDVVGQADCFVGHVCIACK